MKKLLAIVLSLCILVMCTGCSLLPFGGSTQTEEIEQADNDVAVEHIEDIEEDTTPSYTQSQTQTPVQSQTQTPVQSQTQTHTHTWTEATCQQRKTCTTCGQTTGTTAPHQYTEATCQEYATCKVCGRTTGSKASHNYAPEHVPHQKHAQFVAILLVGLMVMNFSMTHVPNVAKK